MIEKYERMVVNRIAILKNSIQEYVWGSKTFIPQLIGQISPAERPQAELWMGAHPKAPSKILWENRWISLEESIDNHPEDILGAPVAERYFKKLPFLFKVLAAAKPLSIQTHPNRKQAKAGFDMENSRKIPMDAPNRNYKDENHKPELICALRPLWALKGFRKIESILVLMEKIGPSAKALGIDILRNRQNVEGLQGFFSALMGMDGKHQKKAIGKMVACVEKQADSEPAFEWLLKLNRAYPGDIGVLAPLLLNVVLLQPGEAVYIPSGELHAYLEGSGLELMANSDNVLRGGLTPKHIDTPELLSVLDFTHHEVDIIKPEMLKTGECVYQTPAAEFILSRISLHKNSPFESPRRRSVEILISVEGEARITDLGNHDTLDLSQGTAVIIPSSVKQYLIQGESALYKAAVPL